MQPKNKNKTWLGLEIIIAVLVLPAGFYLFNLFYSPPLPTGGDWKDAVTQRLPVRTVTMQPTDHQGIWDAINPANILPENRVVAGGHWLLSSAAPDSSDSLWYDGHLISTGGQDMYYLLSPNGQHYAYAHTLDSVPTNSSSYTLAVDNKPVAEGSDMRPYHVSDNGDVYYTCTRCNGQDHRAFYKNDTRLFFINNGNEPTFESLATSQCLYSGQKDPAELVQIQTGKDADGCSPSGKHFYTISVNDTFPEGSIATLHVDSQLVAKGTLSNVIVSDDGKASFLSSDGKAGGRLVLAGKQYTLPAGQFLGGTNGNGGPLFSPSQLHSALTLAPGKTSLDRATWWVDGVNTGYDYQLPVSVDDNAFYVYR